MACEITCKSLAPEGAATARSAPVAGITLHFAQVPEVVADRAARDCGYCQRFKHEPCRQLAAEEAVDEGRDGAY